MATSVRNKPWFIMLEQSFETTPLKCKKALNSIIPRCKFHVLSCFYPLLSPRQTVEFSIREQQSVGISYILIHPSVRSSGVSFSVAKSKGIFSILLLFFPHKIFNIPYPFFFFGVA